MRGTYWTRHTSEMIMENWSALLNYIANTTRIIIIIIIIIMVLFVSDMVHKS